MVLDPEINLALTTAGLRKLLGRPQVPRPKPLRGLICKGCGRSTWDRDEFIEEDFTECPGLDLIFFVGSRESGRSVCRSFEVNTCQLWTVGL